MRFHQLPWFVMMTLTLGFFLGRKAVTASFPANGRPEG